MALSIACLNFSSLMLNLYKSLLHSTDPELPWPPLPFSFFFFQIKLNFGLCNKLDMIMMGYISCKLHILKIYRYTLYSLVSSTISFLCANHCLFVGFRASIWATNKSYQVELQYLNWTSIYNFSFSFFIFTEKLSWKLSKFYQISDQIICTLLYLLPFVFC